MTRIFITEQLLPASKVERRLGRFLFSQFPQFSKIYLKTRLATGQCLVNSIQQTAGYYLKVGDVLEIAVDPNAITSMTPSPIALEVVFEDEHLAVVVKPAGMLVHPTRGIKSGTLANALAHRWGPGIRPGFVHRLDQATSGLLVVARTPFALSSLSKSFQRRQVSKQYHALVDGDVQQDLLTIEAPIGRHDDAAPPWNVFEDGKPATSKLQVLSRNQNQTRVALQPITGRTNQLRIHCAHLGHPIVGDLWYGGSPFQRLCLHAERLEFEHPVLGNWTTHQSPPPF